MTMPNFLILGAAKAGTTSLYRYLGQHPQVYMSPVKEPMFFVLEGHSLDFPGPIQESFIRQAVTDVRAYVALFQGVTVETAIGEASTLYLYNPQAPGRIRHYVPEAKLVAVLRDPVERAFSSYTSLFTEGLEPIADFAQALKEDEIRVREGWQWAHYLGRGFYYAQLRRYFDLFDPTQIKVYLYQDLKDDPVGLLKDLFRFLGVDETFVPDVSLQYNVTRVSRGRTWRAILKRWETLESWLPAKVYRYVLWRIRQRAVTIHNPGKAALTPELRGELVEVYREDILKLQDLLRRDLSAWLE